MDWLQNTNDTLKMSSSLEFIIWQQFVRAAIYNCCTWRGKRKVISGL